MAEEAILGYLQHNEQIVDSGVFGAERQLDHNDVVNVIKSLNGFRYVEAQVYHYFSKMVYSLCSACLLSYAHTHLRSFGYVDLLYIIIILILYFFFIDSCF